MGGTEQRYANVPLSVETFNRIQWEQAMNDVDPRVCDLYSTPFFAKMREAELAADKEGSAAYCLVGSLASMMLRSSDVRQPFRPVAEFTVGRSFMIEDLSDQHWEVLRDLVGETNDVEMRARLADVLWIGKRSYQHALEAIDLYIESAIRLEDPANWVYPAHRIERALRLAVSLANALSSQKVVTHIEKLLRRLNGDDPLYFSLSLMQLLIEFRLGEPPVYAALAEKAASRAESDQDWRRAQAYWDVAAQWHSRDQGPDEERRTRIREAETYVQAADSAVRNVNGNYFGASNSLRSAIEAFRRIPGEHARVQELHSKLLQYQQLAIGTMTHAKVDMDVTDIANLAEDSVTGLSLSEALQSLALIGRSPSVVELRSQVQRQAKDFPVQHIFSAVMLTEEGRVSGQRPGTIGADDDKAEAFFRAEMFQAARLWQSVHAVGMVEPARRRINIEHNPSLTALLPLVTNNPVVPAGHEMLYMKGILAGLDGDFTVAASLLAPQLENSLRHLLALRGLIVTKLDQQGIQDVMDLNALFYSYRQELEAILGDDLTFDLRGLLVERFGTNLRNRSAHGLMTFADFQSAQSEYLWWLSLRLCVLALHSTPMTSPTPPSDVTLSPEDSAPTEDSQKPPIPNESREVDGGNMTSEIGDNSEL